jgi:type I restriction enzyme, S subunit
VSFHSYPVYKPSGVEWLGEVPEHWEVKRIASLYSEVIEAGNEDLPVLSVSIHHGVSDSELGEEDMDRKVTRSEDRSKYKRVEPGDLVYNMMRAWQGAFGSVVVEGMVSPAYVVARPKTILPTEWIEYLLRTDLAVNEIKRFSRGITDFRLRLYWDEFKNLRICEPPEKERACILRFLERETAKIDALIAEQQRLIELLQEKRQAVISHAVTKGLNPNAPMKDSGVEWLGEVPEHWHVKPLKHLAAVQTGMAKGKDLEGLETADIPYLRVANVQDGYLDLEEVHLLSVPITSIERYLLKKGDVLMNEGGDFDKLGRGCIWSGEIEPCVHQNHVFAVRPHSISGAWLNAFTASKSANSYFISRSKQSTNLASISSTNLMGVSVPVPPGDEANEILERLGQRIQEIDALKGSAKQAINLLQERRSALISAAVTGQIDVRGLVEVEVGEQ